MCCCSDLSSVNNLKQVMLHSFTAVSEEVKSAASYALGSISIGNLQQYLPFILKEIEEQPKRQYLLLHSLKEVKYCALKSLSDLFVFSYLGHYLPVIYTTRSSTTIAFCTSYLASTVPKLRVYWRGHSQRRCWVSGQTYSDRPSKFVTTAARVIELPFAADENHCSHCRKIHHFGSGNNCLTPVFWTTKDERSL